MEIHKRHGKRHLPFKAMSKIRPLSRQQNGRQILLG